MSTYQTQAALEAKQSGFSNTRPWNEETAGTAPAAAETNSKAASYAKAEQKMKQGKFLVIGGFVIMLLGMVAYCFVSIGTETNQDFGLSFLSNSSWMIAPALLTMGIGSLVWLVGSFLYFLGGLDSDPNGPELYF